MLKLQEISLTFAAAPREPHKIFEGLSLAAPTGSFIVVLGGNGVGKTTLFHLISGRYQPDAGRVMMCDRDVTRLSQTQRAAMVATVSQDPRLGTMAQMTIAENLALADSRGKRRLFRSALTASRRNLFQEKLAALQMGLEDRLDDLACSLSGGQRQVLSLIMALMQPSEVLLLDEITAALDPKMAQKVMALTSQIVAQEKRTTLMITHNMTHALNYGDQTMILEQGKLTQSFSKKDRKTMTAMDFARLLGEAGKE